MSSIQDKLAAKEVEVEILQDQLLNTVDALHNERRNGAKMRNEKSMEKSTLQPALEISSASVRSNNPKPSENVSSAASPPSQSNSEYEKLLNLYRISEGKLQYRMNQVVEFEKTKTETNTIIKELNDKVAAYEKKLHLVTSELKSVSTQYYECKSKNEELEKKLEHEKHVNSKENQNKTDHKLSHTSNSLKLLQEKMSDEEVKHQVEIDNMTANIKWLEERLNNSVSTTADLMKQLHIANNKCIELQIENDRLNVSLTKSLGTNEASELYVMKLKELIKNQGINTSGDGNQSPVKDLSKPPKPISLYNETAASKLRAAYIANKKIAKSLDVASNYEEKEVFIPILPAANMDDVVFDDVVLDDVSVSNNSMQSSVVESLPSRSTISVSSKGKAAKKKITRKDLTNSDTNVTIKHPNRISEILIEN